MAAFLVSSAWSAEADETGFVPTLNLSFDSGSTVADSNTGSGTIVRSGGAAVFVQTFTGRAFNTVSATPWGTFSNVVPADTSYTVLAYAQLSGNTGGILFHFKSPEGTGSGNTLMLRKGSEANTVVLSTGALDSSAISLGAVDFEAAGLGDIDLDTGWYLYGLVVSSDHIDFYIDGVLVGATPSGTTSYTEKDGYQFGSRHGGMGSATEETAGGGLIDDLRIYTAALTPTQMQAVLTPFRAVKRSISINFATDRKSGDNVIKLPEDATLAGIEPVKGAFWNQVETNNGEQISLINSEGSPTTASLTYSSANTWTWSGGDNNFINSQAGRLLFGYLDDGAPYINITVTDIPYDAYEIIVYQASDTANYAFNPPAINGTHYTFDSTANRIVARNESYGKTQSKALILGGNVLRVRKSFVPGETSDFTGALTLAGGINVNSARGAIAAIQIVEIAPGEALYTRTVTTATGNWFDPEWTSHGETAQSWQQGAAAQIETNAGALRIDSDVEIEKLLIFGNNGFSLTPAPDTGMTFIGDSILDASTVDVNSSIALNTPLAAEGGTITVSATNQSGDGSGVLSFPNTGNTFGHLLIKTGLVDSQIGHADPENLTVTLDGGSLLMTGDIDGILKIASQGTVRIPEDATRTIRNVETTGTLSRAGTGSLVIADSSFGNVQENGGSILFTGTNFVNNTIRPAQFTGDAAPFQFAPGSETTFNGTVSLETATLEINIPQDAVLKVNRFVAADQYVGKTSITIHNSGTFEILSNATGQNNTCAFILSHWSDGTSTYNLKEGAALRVPNGETRIAHSGSPAVLTVEGGDFLTRAISSSPNGGPGGTPLGQIIVTDGSFTLTGNNGVGVRNQLALFEFSGGSLLAGGDYSVEQLVTLTDNSTARGDGVTGPLFNPGEYTVTLSGGTTGNGSLTIGTPETTGTLKLTAPLAHTGTTQLAGGTVDIGTTQQTAMGPVEVTGDVILRIAAGALPDYSDSGAFSPSAFSMTPDARLAVKLDLQGNSVPQGTYNFLGDLTNLGDYIDQFSIELENPGEDLPEDAGAIITLRPDGTLQITLTGITPPKNLSWIGSSSTTWSTDLSDRPWLTEGETSSFANGDTVNFADVAAGSQVVMIKGAVKPAGIVVDNSATAYRLTSDAGTPGEVHLAVAPFTKDGTGLFTFDVPVFFGSTLRINAGELQMTKLFGEINEEENTAVYDKAMTIVENARLAFESTSGYQTLGSASNGVTNNGVFEIGGSGTLEIKGTVTGSGDILKSGEGMFLMSARNQHFTGRIEVTDGILKPRRIDYGSVGAFEAAEMIVRDKGVLLFDDNGDVSGYSVANNPIRIEAGGELRVEYRDTVRRGLILNDGAVTVKNHQSSRTLDFFAGQTIASTGDSKITGLPDGMDINTSGVLNNPIIWLRQDSASINDVQEMKVEGTLTIAATLGSYSNNLNLPGILRKTGSGDLILDGKTLEGSDTGYNGRYPFTYSQLTEVAEGRLFVNVRHNALSTYTVGTDETTGLLGGTGYIAGTNVTVKAGSTIETGLALDRLTLEGGVFLNAVDGTDALIVHEAFEWTNPGTLTITSTPPNTVKASRIHLLTLPESVDTESLDVAIAPDLGAEYTLFWEGNKLFLTYRPGTVIILY